MSHSRALFLLFTFGLLTYLASLLKTFRLMNAHFVGGNMTRMTHLMLFNPAEDCLTTPNDRLLPFHSMPSDVSVALELIRKARHCKDQWATFVQIGANDGVFGDPLYEPMKAYKDCWIGLLVEPQPDLYEKLVTLHQDSDWTFFNGVFAPNCGPNGTIPFCETSTPGEGGWQMQGQTNSLNLAQCENKKLRNKFQIVHHPYVALFEDLIRKHGNPAMVQQIIHETLDFLQIDVEGHDFELLRAIHFDILMPQCIQYKHRHLWGKREEAREFLETKGYTTRKLGMNTLACLVAQGSRVAQKSII